MTRSTFTIALAIAVLGPAASAEEPPELPVKAYALQPFQFVHPDAPEPATEPLHFSAALAIGEREPLPIGLYLFEDIDLTATVVDGQLTGPSGKHLGVDLRVVKTWRQSGIHRKRGDMNGDNDACDPGEVFPFDGAAVPVPELLVRDESLWSDPWGDGLDDCSPNDDLIVAPDAGHPGRTGLRIDGRVRLEFETPDTITDQGTVSFWFSPGWDGGNDPGTPLNETAVLRTLFNLHEDEDNFIRLRYEHGELKLIFEGSGQQKTVRFGITDWSADQWYKVVCSWHHCGDAGCEFSGDPDCLVPDCHDPDGPIACPQLKLWLGVRHIGDAVGEVDACSYHDQLPLVVDPAHPALDLGNECGLWADGVFDDLRIYGDAVTTDAELTALLLETAEPLGEPVLLHHLDEDISDLQNQSPCYPRESSSLETSPQAYLAQGTNWVDPEAGDQEPFDRNRQLWLTVHAESDLDPETDAGVYSGAIELTTSSSTATKTIPIEVTLHPFRLDDPATDHGIFFNGMVVPDRYIKTAVRQEEFEAYVRDMLEHGLNTILMPLAPGDLDNPVNQGLDVMLGVLKSLDELTGERLRSVVFFPGDNEHWGRVRKDRGDPEEGVWVAWGTGDCPWSWVEARPGHEFDQWLDGDIAAVQADAARIDAAMSEYPGWGVDWSILVLDEPKNVAAINDPEKRVNQLDEVRDLVGLLHDVDTDGDGQGDLYVNVCATLEHCELSSPYLDDIPIDLPILWGADLQFPNAYASPEDWNTVGLRDLAVAQFENEGAASMPARALYWQSWEQKPLQNRLLGGFFAAAGELSTYPNKYFGHIDQCPPACAECLPECDSDCAPYLVANPFDDRQPESPGTACNGLPLRDVMTVYPGLDGPIPTTQWEAYREGIDDARYVQTLRNALDDLPDESRLKGFIKVELKALLCRYLDPPALEVYLDPIQDGVGADGQFDQDRQLTAEWIRLALNEDTCGAIESCGGDTDCDGAVDVDDVINVLTDWHTDGSEHGGDVTGPDPGSPPDGFVDVNDIIAVIANWGQCPQVLCPMDEACCGLVCEIDDYCCDVQWDTACTGLAGIECEGTCP